MVGNWNWDTAAKNIRGIQISIILRLPEILINNSSFFTSLSLLLVSTLADFRNALAQLFFCLSLRSTLWLRRQKKVQVFGTILNLRWYANLVSPFFVWAIREWTLLMLIYGRFLSHTLHPLSPYFSYIWQIDIKFV